MEVLVRNAEGNVSQNDRDYAAKKLGRLDRFFHSAQKVEMVHKEDKNGNHRVEITVFADGFTVRGEERDLSLQAAIDKVSEKLEGRLRKLKGRLVKAHRRRGTAPPATLEEIEDHDGHHDLPINVSERKSFVLKPMSIEEASLQMEMVDHPFFVFKDEANGSLSVLYKKGENKYGLIVPEA